MVISSKFKGNVIAIETRKPDYQRLQNLTPFSLCVCVIDTSKLAYEQLYFAWTNYSRTSKLAINRIKHGNWQ